MSKDIRSYFGKPSAPPSQHQNIATASQLVPTSMKGNGLSKERRMNLSPSPKQTKKPSPRANVSNVLISSSEGSDGECPISQELRNETKRKPRRQIVSSDEDEDGRSPSSIYQPAPTNSKSQPAQTRRSPRKHQPEFSQKSPTFVPPSPEEKKGAKREKVARRNSPKLLVTDPLSILAGTNKKRKRHSKDKQEGDGNHGDNPKRSKNVDLVMPENLFDGDKKCAKKTKDKLSVPSVSNLQKRRSSEILLDANTDIEMGQSSAVLATKSKPSKKAVPKEVTNNIPKDMILAGTKQFTDAVEAHCVKKQMELPWVDKYKPVLQKELVGQHTEKSSYNKLVGWLRDWHKYHLGAGASEKKARPTLQGQQHDGSFFKAALLSGPPGIGKTTCAVFACKQLNLQYRELNASSARNKKSVEGIAIECDRMEQYFPTAEGMKQSKVVNVHQVIIMDEVDGMSGNADRAGIAELIQTIKKTRFPIICICNDRQSQKIRSLANYCFDLRFSRPRVEQIKGRLLTIAAKENVKLPGDLLDKIIESSHQDIRQCIHSLQLISSTPTATNQTIQRKDVSVNPFEAARIILSSDSGLAKKQELFFSDYSLMPLFVQENYQNVRSSKAGNAQHMHSIRRSAECIAFGDIISRQVRSLNAWNLLVDQAMFSCVLPALIMDGHLNDQIGFPSWFGKYSATNKRQRLMRELSVHSNLSISGSNHALVVDYLPVLRDRMYRPLAERDTATAVKQVIEVYKNYNLVREDTEAINELGVWPNRKDIAQSVPTKSKSALTRALNKEPRKLPFASKNAFTKSRKKGGAKIEGDTSESEDDGAEFEENDGEEEMF